MPVSVEAISLDTPSFHGAYILCLHLAMLTWEQPLVTLKVIDWDYDSYMQIYANYLPELPGVVSQGIA